MHPIDRVELPATLPDDLDDVPGSDRYASNQRVHQWILDSGNWERGVQAYLASISFADAMVGRLLDALDASGRAENTVVVLFSRSRVSLGRKGPVAQIHALGGFDARAADRGRARASPRQGPGRQRRFRHWTCIRPLPILRVWSLRITYRAIACGRFSRAPKRIGPTTRSRHTGSAITRCVPVTTATSSYENGDEELYDHRVDPHEWYNLASLPEHTDRKARLRCLLPTVNVEPIRFNWR